MSEALLSEQASNKLVEGLLLLIEQKVDERLKADERKSDEFEVKRVKKVSTH